MTLRDTLDALLPQTQCGECGYPGCLPYANALVQGQAPIDRCIPGGVPTLRALAASLGVDPTPYETTLAEKTRPPSRVVIQESECIGCTKCIQACPVDAIMGSAGQMHVVIDVECTGCGLCVPACPVDCVEVVPLPELTFDRDKARQRFQAKQVRLLKAEQERARLYREKRQLSVDASDEKEAKKAYIQAALARTLAKKK